MDASIVGGAVGAVTQFLLTELYSSLRNHKLRSFIFKDDHSFMKKRLDCMTSFLADAQQLEEKHRNSKTLKTLFEQLRDLVYEADDIILDCKIRAIYEEIFPNRHHTVRGKYFRLHAGSTLKRLIISIKDMENELKIYWSPTTYMIHMNKEENTTGARYMSRAQSLSKPFGLEDDTQKIIKWITTDNRFCQIAIVGMGGSGKTTFADKIFNDIDVVDYFDITIRVTVSQTTTAKEFLAKILEKVEGNSRVVAGDNVFDICQSLTNKRFLILMDNVWKPDYCLWEELIHHLPKEQRSKGSIIITTRHEHIAREMGASQIHKMQKLDKNESWNLFSSVAFHANQRTCSGPEFQRLGKGIVEKCYGLPLAIKTIAGVLATKSSINQWRNVYANFSDELKRQNKVLPSLQLSYDDLPPSLKQCILCFSVYPEDAEIDVDQLVYWWVSEGFVQEKKSYTAMEVAFQCIQELVSRCLVEAVEQRGYDGRVHKCKMHDLVRDLIIKISRDEKFCSFDEENKQVPEVHSCHLGYTGEMELELLKDNSKLRAFLLMEHCSFTFHPVLKTVNSLRVLDFSNEELDNVPVKNLLVWMKSQKRLAYLNLQGAKCLTDLPDWIKKRQNMKILVMKDCYSLKNLPSTIIYLRNLVLLDVRNCPLEYFPRGFGKLTNLQVLYGLKLTKQGNGSTSLGELKSLINLRVLRIHVRNNDEIADGEGSVLRYLPRLKILYIDTKNCEKNGISVVNKLMPPFELEELHLCSYCGDTTPYWLTPCTLPELLYLSITGGEVGSFSPRFWKNDQKQWKIEAICLKSLPRFDLGGKDLRSMQYLRYVEVRRCKNLNILPMVLDNNGIWERSEDNNQ